MRGAGGGGDCFVGDFVAGFYEGFVRSRVPSKKFMIFFFAPMVILRPFDLKFH